MASQLILIAAVLGTSAAGIIPAPIQTGAVAVNTEYDPNPQYSYAYGVQDALTGDSKNQQETRSGDVVRGSYSVNEPDGSRRTVDYAADPINGFNAVVRREPLAHVGAPLPVAAPIAPYLHGSPYPLGLPVAATASVARLDSPRLVAPVGLAVNQLQAPYGYGIGNLGHLNGNLLGLNSLALSSNLGLAGQYPIGLQTYASPNLYQPGILV